MKENKKLLPSGESIPENEDFIWITTITDIEEAYPDEEGGPGGWFPFSSVDMKIDPEHTACLVIWRTAFPKQRWQEILKEEEKEEGEWEGNTLPPQLMDRVALYAEAREISLEEAHQELLRFSMDGVSGLDFPEEDLMDAFRYAGFTRFLT